MPIARTAWLWIIQEQLRAQGIISYVEQSRRGGHLWVFFSEPVPASWVRAWLLPFCPTDFEFYPKQDEGKGYGSLICLPLGIHRKSGKRHHFVERNGSGLVSLTITDEDRASWLDSIQRVTVPALEQSPQTARPQPTRPSFSPPVRSKLVNQVEDMLSLTQKQRRAGVVLCWLQWL